MNDEDRSDYPIMGAVMGAFVAGGIGVVAAGGVGLIIGIVVGAVAGVIGGVMAQEGPYGGDDDYFG